LSTPLRVLGKGAGDGRQLPRTVRVRGLEFGGRRPIVIAGPCAVENRAQTLGIAHEVRAAGADMLRGGAFKPRTSPHDFQGLGKEGLEILAAAREETGLPVVTEVLDVRDMELVSEYADMLQIGSRNMHHYPLLREAGRQRLPVLLKRAWCATLKEWLNAAEYIADGGNEQIVLCERGIRSFGNGEYDRNTLDLNVVPAVRRLVDLPVIVDPSHGTGYRDMVAGAALAGVAVGADGLIIEVIGQSTKRSDILCDAEQGIGSKTLAGIVGASHRICAVRQQFEHELTLEAEAEAS
jgi:3-deoxy-7-phosphoheptulonate synthase